MDETSISGCTPRSSWLPDTPLPYPTRPNSEVASVVERILLSLKPGWQTPAFWQQENEFEPIHDFDPYKTWRNVVLSQLLELKLVRLQSIYRLTAFGVAPKRIHAVIECEERVLKQFDDIFRLCQKGMPSTWYDTIPVVSWRPVKLRLTDFGIKAKSVIESMLASNAPELSKARHRYFVSGDVVSVQHKNVAGGEEQIFVSRTDAKALIELSAVPGLSMGVYFDIKEVAVRKPDTMVRIFLDEEDPFDGTKFILADWVDTDPKTRPTSQLGIDRKTQKTADVNKLSTSKPKSPDVKDFERRLAIVAAWREHHFRATGYFPDPMTKAELEDTTEIPRRTASRTIDKMLGKKGAKEGAGWRQYKEFCQHEKTFENWLARLTGKAVDLIPAPTASNEATKCESCLEPCDRLFEHDGQSLCKECLTGLSQPD